jgi:hypothetical protein
VVLGGLPAFRGVTTSRVVSATRARSHAGLGALHARIRVPATLPAIAARAAASVRAARRSLRCGIRDAPRGARTIDAASARRPCRLRVSLASRPWLDSRAIGTAWSTQLGRRCGDGAVRRKRGRFLPIRFCSDSGCCCSETSSSIDRCLYPFRRTQLSLHPAVGAAALQS